MDTRYEIRANWRDVVKNPSLQMSFILAKITDNTFLKTQLMARCISNFVYDTQEQKFLSEEEGVTILAGWIENGEGRKITDGIEKIVEGEMRRMEEDVPEPKSYEEQIEDAESRVDEDELRNFFNL